MLFYIFLNRKIIYTYIIKKNYPFVKEFGFCKGLKFQTYILTTFFFPPIELSCLNFNNNRCKIRSTFVNTMSCSKAQKMTRNSLILSQTVNSPLKLKTFDIFHMPHPIGDNKSYFCKQLLLSVASVITFRVGHVKNVRSFQFQAIIHRLT